MNIRIVDGEDMVPGSNARTGGGRVGADMPSLNSRGGVQPGNSVIRRTEYGALLEVQNAENDRREGGKGKDRRAYSDSQPVIDRRAQEIPQDSYTQIIITYCKRTSIIYKVSNSVSA